MLPSIASLRALRSCINVNVPLHLRTLATQTTTLPLTTDSSNPPSTNLPSKSSGARKTTPATYTGSKEGALRPHLNVPVDPNHGLWAFFRKVKKEDGTVMHESTEDVRQFFGPVSGRSWRAEELRRKSFKDLHTLWYVLLREQNLLATQKEEARRLGALMEYFPTTRKKMQCRKSMARIKYVLNERRLAYEGAVKIFAQRQETIAADALVSEEVQQRVEEKKARKEVQAREREERKEKAVPSGIRIAEQGLFETVQQEQPVKA